MTLKDLRLGICARQEDVAWRCKVHREAVSFWERGLRKPDKKYVRIMAKFFMVPQETVWEAWEEGFNQALLLKSERKESVTNERV